MTPQEGDDPVRAPRRGWPRLGFAGRLALTTSALIFAACTALSLFLVRQEIEDMTWAVRDRGRTLARHLALDAELGVLAGDDGALADLCRQALAGDGVVSCAVLDGNGAALVAIGRPPPRREPMATPTASPAAMTDAAGDPAWEFTAPVTTTSLRLHREELQFSSTGAGRRPGAASDVSIGRIVIGIAKAPLEEHRRRLLTAAAFFTTLVTLLGVASAVALARATTRPLKALVGAARAIARGRLGTTVDVHSRDEVGVLAESFNEMSRSLAQSRAELWDYSRTLEDKVHRRTERLEELNRELSAANQLKSEFLATVSHELRTPLNVILGYVQILGETADGSLGEEQRSMLDAIERYSKLQLELVTSVLDFSRLASGRVSVHVERFALEPALTDIVALHSDSLGQAGLAIRLDVAPDLPELETDRVKLQEVVRNLLDNAVKFTTHGGVEIVARAGEKAGSVVIEVRDTGAGIAPEDLPHVFDEFRQVGTASTRGTGGVGLGLAIVGRLVGVLGGTVTATSHLGAGSTFRVEIPAQLAVEVAERPRRVVAPEAAGERILGAQDASNAR